MFRFILPGLIWLVILVVLSLAPGNELQRTDWFFFDFDKVVHTGIYGFLVHLWLTGFKRQRSRRFFREYAFAIVISSSVALGIAIEFIQGAFIFGRVFDIYDIVANVIGVGAGTGFFYLLYRNYY